MMTPSVKDLHDAIMTCSADVLESYLSSYSRDNNNNNAANLINLNHASLLPCWNQVVDAQGRVHPNCIVATCGNAQDGISALHVAVIQCFFQKSASALSLVKSLLHHGADASLKMNGIYLCMSVSGKRCLVVAENNMTALQLVIFLKKNLDTTQPPSHQEQEQVLNQVTAMLLDITTNKKQQQQQQQQGKNSPGGIQASTVPSSVVHSWKHLLLSSEFCDVKFVCENDNNQSFVCHKAVLAASSEFFRNFFLSESWKRNYPDNVITTNVSSQVLWAVLTYVYCGELPSTILDLHAPELLSVATKYTLPELVAISQAACISKLHVGNVVQYLQLASAVKCKRLEQACLTLVRANAAQVLTNPKVVALAKDNPNLWNKLTMTVSMETSDTTNKVE